MWQGWGGGCFGKNEFSTDRLAGEIMTSMIKIGGITYDTTSFIVPHLGQDGEVYGRKGNHTTRIMGPLSLDHSLLFGELDEFQVNIRCSRGCGELYNMVTIYNAAEEELPSGEYSPVFGGSMEA